MLRKVTISFANFIIGFISLHLYYTYVFHRDGAFEVEPDRATGYLYLGSMFLLCLIYLFVMKKAFKSSAIINVLAIICSFIITFYLILWGVIY